MKFRFDSGDFYVVSQKQIPQSRNTRFLIRYQSLYIYITKESLWDQSCYNGTMIHYMNCFWLVLPTDYLQQSVLWRDFYQCFGEYYEDLIDDNYNIRCIQMLVSHINAQTGPDPSKKILDFGCGSGLSTKVIAPGNTVGYEPVEEMRKQARQRGLKLLTREEIQNMSMPAFDAVFSSYVFHMAVLDEDIEMVLERMKEGAVWVANFYKDINLEHINAVFQRYGCKLRRLKIQEERYGAVYEYQK